MSCLRAHSRPPAGPADLGAGDGRKNRTRSAPREVKQIIALPREECLDFSLHIGATHRPDNVHTQFAFHSAMSIVFGATAASLAGLCNTGFLRMPSSEPPSTASFSASDLDAGVRCYQGPQHVTGSTRSGVKLRFRRGAEQTGLVTGVP